ncbi:hypothetical protein MPSEU_000231900 [Mayamaea pseudoterrestris]|nr:hypothetical protein MPSEU_000231900 [Mayamaea pseudoterrestris]
MIQVSSIAAESSSSDTETAEPQETIAALLETLAPHQQNDYLQQLYMRTEYSAKPIASIIQVNSAVVESNRQMAAPVTKETTKLNQQGIRPPPAAAAATAAAPPPQSTVLAPAEPNDTAKSDTTTSAAASSLASTRNAVAVSKRSTMTANPKFAPLRPKPAAAMNAAAAATQKQVQVTGAALQQAAYQVDAMGRPILYYYSLPHLQQQAQMYHQQSELAKRGLSFQQQPLQVPSKKISTSNTSTTTADAATAPFNAAAADILAYRPTGNVKPSPKKKLKLPGATENSKAPKLKISTAMTKSMTATAESSYAADDVLGRGVTMRPSGKWQAQMYFAGKSRYIGVFDSREKAVVGYETARHLLKKTKFCTEVEIDKQIYDARRAAFEAVADAFSQTPES